MCTRTASILLILTVVILRTIAPLTTSSTKQEKRLAASMNGDFVIGALFPVHHQPSNKNKRSRPGGSMGGYGSATAANMEIKCGRVRELYGIQRVEVVFYALDKINADPDLLPNVTLGVEIRDDCWYAPVALQQSIELIRDAIAPPTVTSTGDFESNDCWNANDLKRRRRIGGRGQLIGVVGPGSSSVALQVQNLLQLFHIPQVGYSTTSRDLSDKSRFNYFVRVVPSDYYQARVMLDVVRYHGWTYVSVVNTDENYGQSGIQAFRELAEEADVCIAREDSVLSNAPDATFDKIVTNLRQDQNAVVVVCFCEGFTVRGLLSATKRLNLTNRFLFIGSDGWADRRDVTDGLESESWGSISIRIHSPYVHDFDRYYWSLNPANNSRNPWFREFWESRFDCTLDESSDDNDNLPIIDRNKTKRRRCSGLESLATNYKQDSKLSFVIKAVYSFAYALHNMYTDICGSLRGPCEKMTPLNGSLLKNYLLNVSFRYEDELLEFDENGDPPGRYDILNYQRKLDGTFDYVQVGDWHNDTLHWNGNDLQFGPQFAVKSVCSLPCPKGQYKNVQKGGKDKRCCWVCVPCPFDEVIDVSTGSTSCRKCSPGFVPDDDHMECLKLPIEHTRWTDTEAIVSMTFATIGMATTTFTFAIFIRYRDTPVVKSSTKELSFIIMAGMVISHVSVVPIIARPCKTTCTLNRLLPGISFATIYSALLTKTNRIARILAGSKRHFPTRKQWFMSATAQVIITSLLIAIEVSISLWTIYRHPSDYTYNYRQSKTVLECNTTPEGILIPLAYDFLLIILCTLYALKTRNVPENFNEAKFIGFAMYTTCVIWIAFVPIYFGSDSKVVTMSVCVTLSAIVTWVFLFLPKLYIILLRPERNNRAMFTTSKTIRCHIGSRVASALAEEKKYDNTCWKQEAVGVAKEIDKRTLSCQTGNELIEVLLNPNALMQRNQRRTVLLAPRIIERNCCQTDTCQLKKITIKLPE